jgi:hypothetical protein
MVGPVCWLLKRVYEKLPASVKKYGQCFAGSRSMTTSATEKSALDRECSIFCRYLIGREPNEYVKHKYRTAHQTSSLQGDAWDAADAFLVKVAGIGSWSTRIIDAYTRVFRPFSIIRKKLVLLLAILESCAPTHAYLDTADSSPIPFLFVRFIQRGVSFLLILLIGISIVLPAELMLRASAKCIVFWLPRNG